MLSEIIDLCQRYNIRLKKELSQNFLHAKHIIQREIELARVCSKDIILDIGAGFGFLTEELAKRAKLVYAIEYDPKIYRVMKIRLQQYIASGKVVPILGDALKVDLPPEVNKIVSNPPFHIVSPLLFRLARTYFIKKTFELAVLIVQYEYAIKMAAKPGEKRSRLSASIQYFADIEIIGKISRKNFFPTPEVDSALVILRPKRDVNHLVDFDTFENVLAKLFTMPNKTLRSILRKLLKKQDLDRLESFLRINNSEYILGKRLRALTNKELEFIAWALKELDLIKNL